MSSSSSSSHKDDEKLKSIVVAGEEKETIQLPEQRSTQASVSKRTITKRPCFGLGVVQTETTNKSYFCRFCNLGFPSPYAYGGHQNIHKKERDLEKQLQNKTVESRIYDRRSYEALFDRLLFSHNSRGPLESVGGSDKDKNNSIIPSLHFGVTRQIPYKNMTMVTHNPLLNKNTSFSYPLSVQGLSSGPFNNGGGGSSSSSAYPLFNGAVTGMKSPTMFPSLTPSYKTSLRDPLLSHNSYALSNDTNLDLNLGTKSIGPSNNNIIYSSFNGQVTRGTLDLNLPVLESITRGIPDLNLPVLESITRDIPPSPSPAHPPVSLLQTSSLPNGMFSLEENGASYSYSRSIFDSKGKNKVMVLGDDDKGLGKIKWLTKKKRSGPSQKKLGVVI